MHCNAFLQNISELTIHITAHDCIDQSHCRDAGVRVEGFMGSQSPAGGLKTTDIAVATIEKANSLVNRLLEEGNIDSLSCVVVDELHMLGIKIIGNISKYLIPTFSR